jgi:carbon-monoxide dehydrogenase medium subunit
MRKLEDFLKGKEITDDVIDEAAEIIPTEISPITDIRSSKEYRTHMMKVMFKRGLKKSLKLQQGGKS